MISNIGLNWGDTRVYSEEVEVKSLKTRRFREPDFVDMLFKMILKHKEMVQQAVAVTYVCFDNW